jgi:tRNA threonylcarbamoyladenosine biosynthesis protein TsaB
VKILALETTDKSGCVAALDDDNVLAALELNPTQRSAQALLPAIRELFDQVGWRPEVVQLIVVAVGPGSFTGLRVGVTVAKTLAYVAGSQVMGVNALEVIARQMPTVGAGLIEAVIDAQRGQLFVGRFSRSVNGETIWLGEATILDERDWLAGIDPGTVVSGPGLAKLIDRLPPGVTAADRKHWNPTAKGVGQLGLQQYRAGRRDDLWKLAPLYFRPSAAEEKWNRHHGV